MSDRQATRPHPHALAVGVLIAGLLASWAAYAPGVGGSLHFDDRMNLGGLAHVHDWASAFKFIASNPGPVGRPLALASFVPQAYAWPEAPEVFLRTNILIHLLNGALVTWFLYLLGIARGLSERRAALVAAGTGAIWLLMPLLASSSLLIVQRMTTLAAVFMLSGAIAYMYARRAIDQKPLMALCGMTLALGMGSAFGVLAKENAVLLFLLMLVVEATLLDRPVRVPKIIWRAWFLVVLIAPFGILIFYLVSVLPYSEAVILRRNFTGLERLLTQAEILWRYLYLAFLPNVQSLGPFHDDWEAQKYLFNLRSIVSIGGWLTVVVAAVSLRRKAPLFAFAVAWYLAGHSLESTTLNLELYFEHRNYIPLIGPVYALVASLVSLPPKWQRIATVGVTAYAAMLGVVLFSATRLWGSPELAAEMWHIYNPSSLRATRNLSATLERDGYAFASRRLMTRYLEANPESRYIKLQILVISCQVEPEADHSETIELLAQHLPIANFDFAVPSALRQLGELVRENQCPSIHGSAVYRLGAALLENPRYSHPRIRHGIHLVMANVGIDQRDFQLAMSHIEAALDLHFHPDTLLLAIGMLISGGLHQAAWDLFEEARDREPPRHPLRALQWQRDLARIEDSLVASTESYDPSR
jgi:protein O-mannosyl-transferase